MITFDANLPITCLQGNFLFYLKLVSWCINDNSLGFSGGSSSNVLKTIKLSLKRFEGGRAAAKTCQGHCQSLPGCGQFHFNVKSRKCSLLTSGGSQIGETVQVYAGPRVCGEFMEESVLLTIKINEWCMCLLAQLPIQYDCKHYLSICKAST